MRQPRKKPDKNEPTFTNIYGKDASKDEFFYDIPFYSEYLLSVCRLFDFPRQHILDVGCGRGEYGQIIRKKCGDDVKSYTGIDIDSQLVLALNNSEIRYGDLMSFKSRRKYDIILCHSVLQYLPSPTKAFAKLRGLVKKSGLVSIFQTMTSADYALYKEQVQWQDPYAWQHSVEDFRQAMFQYFDVISYGILIPKGEKTKDPYTIDKLFLFDR